ncbi:uncharacterized protein [Amphiura filiformis]|uniref:uncharacterized protein n=1 Tax=Amphiura filiformis TaxID=82378 RepID=UPI003B221C6B
MSVSSAIFYGFCSGSMAFLNKTILTSYNFQHPSILLFGQMIFTSIILRSLKTLGYLLLPDVTYDNLILCALPSVFYTIHAGLALSALGGMSIPMYTVLKRCVPLANLLLAVIVLGRGMPRMGVVASVLVITVGCVIAGLGDLTFDLTAYVAGILSVLSQASYLTLVQKLSLNSKMTATGILYLNTLICTPFLFIFILLTFNLSTLSTYQYIKDPLFISLLVLVMCMGMMLNYSIFLCTTLNSALTTSIVGVIKGVVTTLIGMVTFGGVQLTVLNVIGMIVNTIGSVWYVYEKYLETLVSKRIENCQV